jgi:hypothetical protein
MTCDTSACPPSLWAQLYCTMVTSEITGNLGLMSIVKYPVFWNESPVFPVISARSRVCMNFTTPYVHYHYGIEEYVLKITFEPLKLL